MDNNQQADVEEYVLALYITGASPNSTRAIKNLKEICENYLNGKYQLYIIDIYQQPGLAQHENLIVAPTLVKSSPAPAKRFVGDLSNQARVLSGLGLAQE